VEQPPIFNVGRFMEDISRSEEQRGWRRLWLWGIPLALVLGTLLVAALWFNQSSRSGMEDTVGPTQGTEKKQAVSPAVLNVSHQATYGEYLTDEKGLPLYLFESDKQGASGAKAESMCDKECAVAWPPVVTAGKPKSGTSSVNSNLLGTTRRSDGSEQVTYNGWPLYRFAKDFGPEDLMGQDVNDFKGRWHLMSPTGEAVKSSIE